MLDALIGRWWQEAERYNVLPLDNRPVAALLAPRHPVPDHPRYVYWPGDQRWELQESPVLLPEARFEEALKKASDAGLI